jgi:hypothetical protein
LTMANDRREMQMEGDRYMSKHRYNLEDWDVDKDELYLRFDFYHKSIFGQHIHGKSRKIR